MTFDYHYYIKQDIYLGIYFNKGTNLILLKAMSKDGHNLNEIKFRCNNQSHMKYIQYF